MSSSMETTPLLRPAEKRAEGSVLPRALTVVTLTLAVAACASYASPSYFAGALSSLGGSNPVTFKLYTKPCCEPPQILETFKFDDVVKAKVVTKPHNGFDMESGFSMTETSKGSGVWELTLPRHQFKEGVEWGFGIEDSQELVLYDVGEKPGVNEKCVTHRKNQCHFAHTPLFRHTCGKLIDNAFVNRVAEHGRTSFEYVWGTCDDKCDGCSQTNSNGGGGPSPNSGGGEGGGEGGPAPNPGGPGGSTKCDETDCGGCIGHWWPGNATWQQSYGACSKTTKLTPAYCGSLTGHYCFGPKNVPYCSHANGCEGCVGTLSADHKEFEPDLTANLKCKSVVMKKPAAKAEGNSCQKDGKVCYPKVPKCTPEDNCACAAYLDDDGNRVKLGVGYCKPDKDKPSKCTYLDDSASSPLMWYKYDCVAVVNTVTITPIKDTAVCANPNSGPCQHAEHMFDMWKGKNM